MDKERSSDIFLEKGFTGKDKGRSPETYLKGRQVSSSAFG